MSKILTRRRTLIGAGAASLMLAGCDRLVQNPNVAAVIEAAERVTMRSQRLLMPATALAREFTQADISPVFRANGTSNPDNDEYSRLREGNFVDWRLKVDGLVEHPFNFSLDDLRKMPSRTQITRHDCVEGWSAIGKWTGVPLGHILEAAKLKPNARYIVFHCADELELTLDGSGKYYESVDLVDAFHPQTILAYDMNDKVLGVPNGAPLRLRVERQLGYKHAKYLMRIEAVETLAPIAGGQGGYWEDRGYEWYAGI
ncbi:molybdopterin-binding protein [soil metagenome]